MLISLCDRAAAWRGEKGAGFGTVRAGTVGGIALRCTLVSTAIRTGGCERLRSRE